MSQSPDLTGPSAASATSLPVWTRLAPAEAIAPGQIVDVSHGEEDLVVWRTADGEPCVMSARCPHLWSHLGAEGIIEGQELVCCSHGWRFDTSGSGTVIRGGQREPMTDIAVHPVAERDGAIWGELASSDFETPEPETSDAGSSTSL